MTAAQLRVWVAHEWRLRSRRTSSLVLLLAVVALSWVMVQDPATGIATMVVHRQRMAYDSATLAFATSVMAAFVFGLAGFFLARGRSEEDWRCGTAQVLAATPASAAQMLAARWLGGVAFLLGLAGLSMLTVWVLQAVRGEGPLQPGPYLQMLGLGLLPGLMWTVSLAVLADAWAPLLRKRGDLMFLALWLGQLMFLPLFLDRTPVQLSGWQVFDFQGLSVMLVGLSDLMDVAHVSVGGGVFDPALPLLHMPPGLWTRELVALRVASMLVALVPLGVAVWVFHRYAPDRIGHRWAPRGAGASATAAPRSAWRQPLRWLPRALLRAATRVPGRCGQALGDLGLMAMSQPALTTLLVLGGVAGAVAPLAVLPGVMAASAAAWGVAVSDLASREWQFNTAGLCAAVPGGREGRHLRLVAVAWVAGACVLMLAAWRLGAVSAIGVCAAGLLAASSLAVLLGHLTRGGRTFMASFLFLVYLSVQRTGVPALDPFGWAGSASAVSAWAYAGVGVLALTLPRMRPPAGWAAWTSRRLQAARP